MKSISFFLASLLCAGSPAVAEQSSPATSIVQAAGYSFQLGATEIERVRAEFNAGKYSEFLKEMDCDYKEAKKSNGLEGLIEIRKESARVQIHPEFARSFRLIQEDRNKQLLEIVKGDDSILAKKIKSVASSQPTREESLISLYGKAPGSSDDQDENQIIDIDLEYYYKAIHLDGKSNQSLQERKDKHLALEMDKMARIVQASQSFENKDLKSAVERDALTLDARLARNYDMSDLNALARGKIKPASALEKKSAAIVSRSQGDLSELHHQLQNSLDESQTVQN